MWLQLVVELNDGSQVLGRIAVIRRREHGNALSVLLSPPHHSFRICHAGPRIRPSSPRAISPAAPDDFSPKTPL